MGWAKAHVVAAGAFASIVEGIKYAINRAFCARLDVGNPMDIRNLGIARILFHVYNPNYRPGAFTAFGTR
jgi:hypothetical protein